VGRLVESYYRIDVSEALRSAQDSVVQNEFEDRRVLFYKAKILQKYIESSNPNQDALFKKAGELGFNQPEKAYFAYIKKGRPVQETHSLISQLNLENFRKKSDEIYENFTLYQLDRSFILVKCSSQKYENYLILGKRVHQGNERNIYNIIHTQIAYNTTNLWKERVPFSMRFALGIFTSAILAISIVVSLILARQISRPIVQLANATQRVSRGETDVQLDLKEEGEMGILIESFNQMTRDLKAKNEELLHIQRIAAWKEVAQRMAHEIKNPLTPIQLSAERILKRLDHPNREKFEEVVKTGTETIIGQVKVLEHLVKEFSEFARMPNPILVNQSLNPIVEESVNLFRDHVNINFVLKLSKNLPEVFLDKRLFLGVINNLIKNAVEAITNDRKDNPPLNGETLGTIRISTKMEKQILRKSVVLSIEDSGPGIPKNIQEKIFQPYFSTKAGHGTGIGLAIVEKTVFDHHGHLSIENSSMGGCNFKIELPLEGGK
jgi:nitrogen fixation/metabolism regulation signal transduction histidine kinase